MVVFTGAPSSTGFAEGSEAAPAIAATSSRSFAGNIGIGRGRFNSAKDGRSGQGSSFCRASSMT